MSDAPETIWANCSAHENWDDLNASAYRVDWWHEYRRADLPAPDPMDDPRVMALVEALQVFSDCADLLDEETRETGREYPDGEWAKFRLLVSDYRRARAALAAMETDNA